MADAARATASGRPPLGILAGGSAVPIELAEAVIARGGNVHIVGLEGEAESEITQFPHTWVNWGGVGRMMSAFRDNGCREIVIIGRVRRPNLARIRPDLGFWLALPQLLRLLRGGDDAILRMVVGFFERHGLKVIGAHEAAPELLAPAGVLGARRPSETDMAAVTHTAAALTALGPFDAAQAAAGSASRLMVMEGADGTDAMLRRLGELRLAKGSAAALVKLPKPGQERRIDLPAIGPETVRRAAAVGLSGIAVRTGETLIAERSEVVRLADATGLYVIGLDAAPSEPERAPEAVAVDTLSTVAGVKPSASALTDAGLALKILGAVEPFWPQASTVVSRGYVLATEGAGRAVEAAERSGRLKPWGAKLLRRKVGVLAMSDLDAEAGFDARRLVTAAASSGLAGLVILKAPRDQGALAAVAQACDGAKMFLLAPGGVL